MGPRTPLTISQARLSGLRPGVHSDGEALVEVAQKAVAASDQEKVFGFLGQMGAYHPTEPHWYLPFIGVDPVKQGSGYGSALLKHALQNADRDKLPPTWNQPARAAAGSTSATASRRSEKFSQRTRRQCGPCCANLSSHT